MKWLLVFALGLPLLASHEASNEGSSKAAIQAMLNRQAEAWNRGDLSGFVAHYAPLCTLVGSEITETTRSRVLAHYREKYPSRDRMGKLAFSKITIHVLDAGIATVTAYWHLERSVQSGGPVGGVFSLVCQLSAGSWQIVLDHTSRNE
jgi:ketosteroid isomerase-like protein